jgi:hypothetical protein
MRAREDRADERKGRGYGGYEFKDTNINTIFSRNGIAANFSPWYNLQITASTIRFFFFFLLFPPFFFPSPLPLPLFL